MEQQDLPLDYEIGYSFRFLQQVEGTLFAVSPVVAKQLLDDAFGKQITHMLDIVPMGEAADWRQNFKNYKPRDPKPRGTPTPGGTPTARAA